MRIDPLCKTLSGNVCPMITITDNLRTYKSWETELNERQISENARRFIRNKASKKPNEHNDKKAVIITARVHPGESNASFVMKGVID